LASEDLGQAQTGAARRFLKPSRPDVHGVAVGRKVAGGALQDESAIIVYVEKKLPKSRVARARRIPATVAGIPTDVIETGVIRCCAARRRRGRKPRFRPAPGGVCVGHPDFPGAGTLGCLVRQGRGRFALCAGHVAANVGDGGPGDPLLQPARLDRGTNRDRLGRLFDFTPIRFGGPLNQVDAAIVRVTAKAVTAEIAGVGIPTGVEEPLPDTVVVKSGRTTGVTRGAIVATRGQVRVFFPERGPALFGPVVAIEAVGATAPFVAEGDSGAIVLEARSRKACAMVLAHATARDLVFALPLEIALDALNVTLPGRPHGKS
jgi:hypothetical protein